MLINRPGGNDLKRLMKGVLIALGSLIGLVLIAVIALLLRFSSQMGTTYSVKTPELTVPTSSAALARGEHLAHINGCTDCHGSNLAGKVMMEKPPIGRLVTTNLTRGKNGVAEKYKTIGDWDRAIRHGLRYDGRPLYFMPSVEFYYMGDDDLTALVAYLQSVPPADSDLPPTEVMFVAKILDQFNLMVLNAARRIDHEQKRPDAPPPGPTKEYGLYLARGCAGCHGDHFAGGTIPGAPPSLPVPKNLTRHETGLAKWTEADFAKALREGVRPDGSKIDPFMPIASTKHLTDDELKAMWLFFQSLPPMPFGNR
jgi:cytochrome c553